VALLRRSGERAQPGRPGRPAGRAQLNRAQMKPMSPKALRIIGE
jgi:hypothetical protein